MVGGSRTLCCFARICFKCSVRTNEKLHGQSIFVFAVPSPQVTNVAIRPQ
jgi:hypothetical protein